MKEEYKKFAAQFAQAVIDENITAAHELLAPWLRTSVSVEELRAEVEKWLLEVSGAWGIDELIYPAQFRLDGNVSSLASLREDPGWREPRAISDEVTEENFRHWLVIQFLPDEDDERIEFNAWFDFWFVLVETSDGFRIGFYEFADAD